MKLHTIRSRRGPLRSISLTLIEILLFAQLWSSRPAMAEVPGIVRSYSLLPFKRGEFCLENEPCSFKGTRQVFYGTQKMWRVGIFTDEVVCNNATFGDPANLVQKHCYFLPPSPADAPLPLLDSMEAIFNGDDLITVENARYTLEFLVNGNWQRATAPYSAKLLSKLAVPDSQQSRRSFFQFLITDTHAGPVSYNVLVASTDERCLLTMRQGDKPNLYASGRVMEIYAVTADPKSGSVSDRSTTQRVCTTTKGKLAFLFKPPALDAFQIKVLTHDDKGNAVDVTDFFLPVRL